MNGNDCYMFNIDKLKTNLENDELQFVEDTE
jgi:hypothetical protein